MRTRSLPGRLLLLIRIGCRIQGRILHDLGLSARVDDRHEPVDEVAVGVSVELAAREEDAVAPGNVHLAFMGLEIVEVDKEPFETEVEGVIAHRLAVWIGRTVVFVADVRSLVDFRPPYMSVRASVVLVPERASAVFGDVGAEQRYRRPEVPHGVGAVLLELLAGLVLRVRLAEDNDLAGLSIEVRIRQLPLLDERELIGQCPHASRLRTAFGVGSAKPCIVRHTETPLVVVVSGLKNEPPDGRTRLREVVDERIGLARVVDVVAFKAIDEGNEASLRLTAAKEFGQLVVLTPIAQALDAVACPDDGHSGGRT